MISDMQTVEILALVIFILTYLLIAVNKTPWFEIKRSYVALIGGALMLVVGALSLDQAWDSIDFKVIFLLLGMMCMVAGLEYTGFFNLLSNIMMKHSSPGPKLLLSVMFLSAFTSAIALNDAVVLMFTPIVIRCCHNLKVNPIPYLIGLMISANIGSIATAVGNPQNAYIASYSGMTFAEFSKYSIPIAIVCLILSYAMLVVMFRGSLSHRKYTEVNIEDESNIDKVRLTAMIILVIATFVGFMLTGIYDFELYQVALVAGAVSLIIVMTSSPKDAVYVAKRVDWHILLFFIGLFVLIGGAFDSGLITEFTKDLGLFSEGTPDPLGLSVFTVILSNLVSNVPAVMLTAQMFVSADTMTWIVLAASSTLAGNMTLLGSAANIIVAERSERYGIRVDFARHMLIGTMITVATVAVMLLCVAILF